MPLPTQPIDLEQSISSKIFETITTPVVGALEVLDIPGSILRGAISGRGFTPGRIFGEDQGTSGKQFLQGLGDKDPSLPASIAAEFIDPLFLLGSFTGLNKVGKAVKTASEAEKVLSEATKIKKATQLLGRGSPIRNKLIPINKIIKEQKQRIKALNVDAVFPATRAEQAAAGLRGPSLKIPFTKLQKDLPRVGKAINAPIEKKVIAPIAKLFENNKLIGAVKKKFVVPTKSAQELINEGLVESARAESAATIEKLASGKDKELNLSDVITGVENTFSPKKVRKLQTELATKHREKLDLEITKIKEKFTNRINKAKTFRTKQNLKSEMASKVASARFKTAGEIKATTIKFNARMEEMQKALDTISDSGELTTSFISALTKAGEDALKFQESMGVSIKGISEWIGYLPHVLSREGRVFYNSNKEFRKVIGEVVGDFTPHLKSRRLKGGLAAANAELKKKFGVDFDFFTNDVERLYKATQVQAQIAVNRAVNVQSAVLTQEMKLAEVTKKAAKGLGKEVSKLTKKEIRDALRKEVGDLVPLERVLKRGKMSKIVINGRTISFDPKSAFRRRGSNEIRKVLKENEVALTHLPKSVVDDLFKVEEVYRLNTGILGRTFDLYTNTMKTWLTGFHPAHFTTNAIGNLTMNIITMGPVNTVKYTALAAAAIAGGFSKQFKGLVNVPKKLLSSRQQQLVEFLKAGGAGTRATKAIEVDRKFINFADIKGAKGKALSKISNSIQRVNNNPLTKLGFFVNNLSEQTNKLAHFMFMRDQGRTTIESIISTKKYHFDYGELTPFEKGVMKRLVLFYTFMRKNLPLAVTETFANRRALALEKISAGSLNTEDFIPEYVRDVGAIAVGNDTFVDVRNPLFEANRFGSQGGGAGRPIERSFGVLSPILKLGIENLITGRESFRGRPLKELNRVRSIAGIPAEKLPFTKTFVDNSGKKQTIANPLAIQLFRNLPTARIQQSLEDVSRPDISSSSLLFGRTRVLPRKERRSKRIIELLQRRLGEQGDVGEFKRFFSTAQEARPETARLLKNLETERDKLKRILR